MSRYVLKLNEVDKTKIALVGGKGANLGELSRIEGINVPDGFCVTTGALDKNIEPEISQLTTNEPYAVRSSATAEDLPTASFAGQHDTYLNIIGTRSILEHIKKCQASLFNPRAVAYRDQNGFDSSKVGIAVVVQKMVFPEVSGVMFTADPVSGNRKVVSIDASFGLGEALVSGIVNADNYKVREGTIVDRRISTKKIAIYGVHGGGTREQKIDRDRQNTAALTDKQILELEQTGRKIEQHFGSPQDIEWCIAGDKIYIVQSRPITTLFPIPETGDNENHVFVSVGHQQMMTDAMKPLGLSVRQLNTAREMYTAAGRMFIDVAQDLASPARRYMLVEVLGKSDPLIKDAWLTILERKDFIKTVETPETKNAPPPPNYMAQSDDPSIVDELIKNSEAIIDELDRDIQNRSGTDLMDFIRDDIRKLTKTIAEPGNFSAIMTSMNASHWINDKMKEWLGEKNVADIIAQSAPNNITSEMGLDLLDVADVIRPCPEVVEYLQRTKTEDFLGNLAGLEGGKEAKDAIDRFLDKYGMRCVGEIDITRKRWAENPLAIVPMIISNIKNLPAGESKRKFEQGKEQSLNKEKQLLEQLRTMPDGDQKAKETKQMIDRIRNFAGYREYPKYHIVSRYFIYKKALMKEAELLVRSGVVRDKEDIFYVTFEELRDIIRTKRWDGELVTKRKEEFSSFVKLTPPRVYTSEGEIITGKYRREDLPENAIAGLPVSSGVIEGRARVILSIEDADLDEGDILVTAFTDPSWTPLFVSIKGLVAEVGGLMTHGSVIAREYGLPAVVGVDNATRLIKDGQRIRVNGTEGYVEILG